MKTVQACFVKDLDFYLEHFPESEAEMRQLFGLVFQVGTSAYWENDGELVTELHRTYWTLDKGVIRPWVKQEEKRE